ncbi:hypothetical protein LC593_36070 [Nostoc sp. CHAB 5844]|nr:hypothetical protein [Nostoc sp. CHAB 5844]
MPSYKVRRRATPCGGSHATCYKSGIAAIAQWLPVEAIAGTETDTATPVRSSRETMCGSRSWGKPRQFLQRGEPPQRTGSPRPRCLTTRLAQLCAFNFLLLPYLVMSILIRQILI